VKHGQLASIAHNIAHSLASGVGLMIGVYCMDIFGEADRSSEGFIEVDFLTGATKGARPSDELAAAIRLYVKALPGLCERQGVAVEDFRTLNAEFRGPSRSPAFVVHVVDRRGKESRRRFSGYDGAAPTVLDPLGRRRRSRSV
jgi:hypothetical protein